MTKTTEPVLEPCAFCSGTNCVIGGVNDPRFFLVACRACHTQGPAKITEAEAIAAWNTRPAPSPDVATLSAESERLREALLFYANIKNYRHIIGVNCTSVDIDAGDTARAALETKHD